jgi:hypothetical protein
MADARFGTKSAFDEEALVAPADEQETCQRIWQCKKHGMVMFPEELSDGDIPFVFR